MKSVIVNKSRDNYEAIDLQEFIKEYGITPKCQGDNFYILQSEGRDLYISSFPNPACAFINGRIQYIIYKGGTCIINGIVQPPCEYLEENQVFESYEEAKKMLIQIDEQNRGECWIDCPDGKRIILPKQNV